LSPTRTFNFRSRPEAVAAARRALDGFDELLDLGVFYDASLCVSELVTNAVLHADIPPEEELRLDVAIDGETLRVVVTDPGNGFRRPAATPGDESGWGLYIVDRLSHRWGVERDRGTRVWFEMGVKAPRDVPEPEEEPEPPIALDSWRRRRKHEGRGHQFPRNKLRPETTP
jgi:anti-sigma regulatory factor (Ser/Thr protein kinase)